MREFDVVVIGAGPAGYEVASLLAKGGKDVCIVEKNEEQIGGTCLNEGCVPAKHYLESAGYMAKQSYFESCGVHIENMSLDLTTLKNKKTELIDQLRVGIGSKLSKSKVNTVIGTAIFEDSSSIRVGSEIIFAKQFIIATGSIHRAHPLLEIDGKQIISSKEVFELTKIPKSILIVGGGAIGCEFATFFNSIGTEVHISEFTPSIIPAEDTDVSRALKRELEKKGISISVDSSVIECIKHENSIDIKMMSKKGEVEASYEMVLVSIGRVPNASKLSLENAGVDSDRGFVLVDEVLRTSNPNIYAIGDVISTPSLAHTAYNEAAVVAKNILEGSASSPSTVIPFVTFSQPQVASVGKNEKMLKEEGIEYKVLKQFYKSNSKAKIKGDDSGFVKLLCEKESGVILGGAMIGNDATELIHQILIAINARLSKDELADMVFAHPTLSESLWEMLQ